MVILDGSVNLDNVNVNFVAAIQHCFGILWGRQPLLIP